MNIKGSISKKGGLRQRLKKGTVHITVVNIFEGGGKKGGLTQIIKRDLEYQRTYYEANRERCLQYHRKYYQANKERKTYIQEKGERTLAVP